MGIGNGLDENVFLGPVIREEHKSRTLDYIESGVKAARKKWSQLDTCKLIDDSLENDLRGIVSDHIVFSSKDRIIQSPKVSDLVHYTKNNRSLTYFYHIS